MNNQSDFLEDLTIEQLNELLLTLSDSEEDAEQEVLAERIMEVMLKKEAENPTGFFRDTETSWNEFVNVYLPKTEEDKEFVAHFLDDDDDIEPAATDLFEVPTVIPNKKKRRFLSSIAAIAAIIVLLNIFTLTAYGLNLIQVVAKWGEGVFYHESVGAASTNSLAIVLDSVEGEFDTTFNFYPSWLPADLELIDAYAQELDSRISLTFSYENENSTSFLVIKVTQFDDIQQNNFLQEKNLLSNDVSLFERNGIAHYIFENLGTVTTTWAVDRFECIIVSNIPHGDMEKCIASIYEGVD
jgi:hypothetical protein